MSIALTIIIYYLVSALALIMIVWGAAGIRENNLLIHRYKNEKGGVKHERKTN
jgi:hypothetical protein